MGGSSTLLEIARSFEFLKKIDIIIWIQFEIIINTFNLIKI
jgi:hypothetical protein